MRVKDVMLKEIITVKRSTTLKELLEIFTKFHIAAFPLLPVVEKGNRLVGNVTLEEVMRIFQPYRGHFRRFSSFLEEREAEDISLTEVPPDAEILFVVDDLMNPHPVTIDEEASLSEARSQMKLHKVERLCVVKNHRLVGLVGMFDIIMGVFREKGLLK